MTLGPTDQKLRGGYYTPSAIAQFLANWAVRSPLDQVLEPSCGDGNILVATAKRLIDLGAFPEVLHGQMNGVELDPIEAQKASARLRTLGVSSNDGNIVHVGDFFAYCQRRLFGDDNAPLMNIKRQQFDVVIGNPPFIRYQNFPESHRRIAFELMRMAALSPNRLTNVWLPFLAVGSMLLKEDGRLAMVIPAELFQVNYAAEMRQFLSDYYNRVTLITFQQLLFEGIQQEVVLLLAERNHVKATGIRAVELKKVEDLTTLTLERLESVELKPMDHSVEKWTQYFLSLEEILLLRELRQHPKLTHTRRVLSVDVGIVTGRNDFFVLNKKYVKAHRLEPYLERVVSRSGHLDGLVFSSTDWQKNVDTGLPTFLFTLPSVPVTELPESIQQYISFGEKEGIHQGYKCRIRSHWYAVPSVWIPDAFALRQVHSYPKLVLNDAQAVCTDTIHRIRFSKGITPNIITTAFINSLTFAFAEVTGRSYGGGVLTFEPSEIEALPLPLLGAEHLDLAYLDKLVRKNDINSVLDITDKILLADALGLTQNQISLLRGIWIKLRGRRVNRK